MAQRLPSPDDDVSGDDLDEVLGRANPNPDRIGCPSRDVLVDLARRARPMDDPAYQHLLKCSPCYLEVRALQAGASAERRASSGRPAAWLALAAALILLGLGTVVWQRMNVAADPGQKPVASNEPQLPAKPTTPSTANARAKLDLREFRVFRNGEGQASPPEVVTLPSGVLDLTLLLPVGSEPGVYEVRLLDSDLRSIASGRGTGEVRDFVTTVRVTLDLSGARRAAYQLAVRREDDQWRLFSARVN